MHVSMQRDLSSGVEAESEWAAVENQMIGRY
jgi:hypothetical protein